jgi:hypothetical protein
LENFVTLENTGASNRSLPVECQSSYIHATLSNMGYEALILGVAAVATLPFALWMRRRMAIDGSRRVNTRIGCTFVGILAVLSIFSGLAGYFYPYGGPGREIPHLRANSEECAKHYAGARSKTESTAIDALILDSAFSSGFSCGTLRRNRLPGCQRGTRCARLKKALRLPD